MSRYVLFDVNQVVLGSLSERGHLLTPSECLPLCREQKFEHPDFQVLIEAIVAARRARRPVIWMMGAHPIKLGLSRFVIDLMRHGWITHVATNGAGLIHDYELALGEGTSEDVARWIQHGQFGLWRETSQINDIVRQAAQRGEGLGEALGRTIVEQQLARADLSIAAAGWHFRIPVTAHVSIGSDIVHAHPNCDGAAWGKASYTDFLIFAESIRHLEGGVFLNIGTAVTGPEVYLKALSMARNVARHRGLSIRHFTAAVFDLTPIPKNYRQGTPPSDDPLYYYRPWKTILVRTVAEGGRSFYFQGDHRITIPNIWYELTQTAVEQPKVA